MVATITPINHRVRLSTPERWQSALLRAMDQGVTVRQLQCGVWVAASGTDSQAAYAVTLDDCECRAAMEGDPVCKHRAALRHQLGMLDITPEPPTPAAPLATGAVAPVARRQQAAAERAIAYIERMAALHGDEMADFGWAS